MLLVILGSPPPVVVHKIPGCVQLEDAIAQRLDKVDVRSDAQLRPEDVIIRVPDTVAWTTWGEIRAVLAAQRRRFSAAPEGLGASVTRLCDAAIAAIDWHG